MEANEEMAVETDETLESDAVPELVRRALHSRPERLARSEVRRAARRAPPGSGVEIRVARPVGDEGRNRDAFDLADARAYTWVRTSEAEAALTRGDMAAAAVILNDVLQVEQAIRVLVDDVAIAPQWRELADQLSHASDVAIAGIRRSLASADASAGLAEVRTGQSVWIRAWRPFLLVIEQGV